MSNRRRARRLVPLNGLDHGVPARELLPPPLDFIEWTDTPAAGYPTQVLEWIAGQAPTRGRFNVWVCESCHQAFLCYDRHPGTTPFTVAHQTLDPETSCQGITVSTFYNGDRARDALVELGAPSHEWYRPSATALRHESRAARDHVLQGGLLVRPVTA